MRAIEKLLKKKNISIYKLSKLIGQSYQRTEYIVKTKNFSEDYLILKNIAESINVKIDDIIDKPKNDK